MSIFKSWSTCTIVTLNFENENFAMPPRRAQPKPDSMAAHPAACRLLANLISSGVVKTGDKAKKWRLHPNYKTIFQGIDQEKFRKKFVQLLKERDEPTKGNIVASGMLFFRFLFQY